MNKFDILLFALRWLVIACSIALLFSQADVWDKLLGLIIGLQTLTDLIFDFRKRH